MESLDNSIYSTQNVTNATKVTNLNIVTKAKVTKEKQKKEDLFKEPTSSNKEKTVRIQTIISSHCKVKVEEKENTSINKYINSSGNSDNDKIEFRVYLKNNYNINLEELKQLIKESRIKNLEFKDNKGNCAVHYVLNYSKFSNTKNIIETLKYFIELKIQLNGVNNLLETALHIACLRTNYEICKYISSNTSLKFTDKTLNQETPVHYACKNNLFNEKNIIEQIYGHYICDFKTFINDDNKLDQFRKSIVMLISTSYNINILAVEFFCEKNELDKFFYMKDRNGNTPLHLACCYSFPNVIKKLADNFFKTIDMTNKQNKTPFELGLSKNKNPEVQEFLKKEIEIRQRFR